jgi:ferredoxin
MATIHFASAKATVPDLVVEIAGSERLLDICDQSHAPVAFSCRGATCATCRVEILEGAELLEPAGEAERELLTTLGSPPSTRLACQAIVLAAVGVIRLRWGA